MSVWQFADWIAAVPPAHRLMRGEGHTPLVRSCRLAPAIGADRLFLKLESSNPTGSYKDRFAAVEISALLAAGKTRCVGTSSGNTGAALAAYCAAAGIACELAIVEAAPAAKLAQMLAYGAKLKRVRGFGLDAAISRNAFSRLEELGAHPQASLVISAFHYSPIGMTGVETISYELDQQLSASAQAIDHVFVPAGGGGLALAIARGFQRLAALRPGCRFPAVHVVQPEGNDTIAGPLRMGMSQAREVNCTSAISGLQVPSVIDGDALVAACRASGGTGHVVTDDDVRLAQSQLARQEGLFAEPAGAVALAGAMQAIRNREVEPHATIVCIVTGSGFKDAASLSVMTRDCPCPLVEWNEL